MSTFMSALDSSIVNVALPKMAKALHVTTSNIQLVATSYLIVIAGTVLVFGRLGDMLGKTKVFIYGIAIFTFGSLLCGITSSFPVLIIARAIQATGAAGMMANNQGIITEAIHRRHTYDLSVDPDCSGACQRTFIGSDRVGDLNVYRIGPHKLGVAINVHVNREFGFTYHGTLHWNHVDRHGIIPISQ
jgi:hypothetical protein